MLKLGTTVYDVVTELEGMLTHFQIEGPSRMYVFQPRGLNPKTLEPLDTFWIDAGRVRHGIIVDAGWLPINLLGTQVEDQGSVVKGTAVALVLHTNGCVHFDVQPAGVVPSTGAKIARHNFDIRRLVGPAIKPQTDAEYEASTKRTPSPNNFPRLRD